MNRVIKIVTTYLKVIFYRPTRCVALCVFRWMLDLDNKIKDWFLILTIVSMVIFYSFILLEERNLQNRKTRVIGKRSKGFKN